MPSYSQSVVIVCMRDRERQRVREEEVTRLYVCSCIVVQGVPESPTIWKTPCSLTGVFMNPFVIDYRLNVHFNVHNQCRIIYCEIKNNSREDEHKWQWDGGKEVD